MTLFFLSHYNLLSLALPLWTKLCSEGPAALPPGDSSSLIASTHSLGTPSPWECLQT